MTQKTTRTIDEDRVDETILALLFLTLHDYDKVWGRGQGVEGSRLGRLGTIARERLHRRSDGQAEVAVGLTRRPGQKTPVEMSIA